MMDKTMWSQVIRVIKRTSPRVIKSHALAKRHICGNEPVFELAAGLVGIEGFDWRMILESELDEICWWWYELWKDQMIEANFDISFTDSGDIIPYEEIFDMFMAALPKVKFAKRDAFNKALDKAKTCALPPEASELQSKNLKLIAALCYQLQLIQKDKPFWLTGEDAGLACGRSQSRGAQMLTSLVRRGIIRIVKRGHSHRATTYQYIFKSAKVKHELMDKMRRPGL